MKGCNQNGNVPKKNSLTILTVTKHHHTITSLHTCLLLCSTRPSWDWKKIKSTFCLWRSWVVLWITLTFRDTDREKFAASLPASNFLSQPTKLGHSHEHVPTRPLLKRPHSWVKKSTAKREGYNWSPNELSLSKRKSYELFEWLHLRFHFPSWLHFSTFISYRSTAIIDMLG